jgi:hypothetical protein
MRDKLLYLTIGLLIGIVVMQWTMPAGRASIIAPPAGEIVAVAHQYLVTRDGHLWSFSPQNDPYVTPPCFNDQGTLPMPVEDVKFFSFTPGSWSPFWIVDAAGNVWSKTGVNTWRNWGPPPVEPVPASSESWGGVKGKFEKRD